MTRRLLVLLMIVSGPIGSVMADTPFDGECFGHGSALSLSELSPPERVSEENMNFVFDRLTVLYGPEVAPAGRLNITQNPSMEFRAFADRKDGQFKIEIYKGFRFHRFMTADSYALLVCHEMGHHLAGYPRFANSNWSSVESQADYFASLKCLRRYLGSLEDRLFSELIPPQNYIDRCTGQFSLPKEIRICARSMAASLVLSEMEADIRGFGSNQFPSLSKVDPQVVEQTIEAHRGPQCRLDSFRAGSLCRVPDWVGLSDKNHSVGACHENYDPENQRPHCWFAPPREQVLSSL